MNVRFDYRIESALTKLLETATRALEVWIRKNSE